MKIFNLEEKPELLAQWDHEKDDSIDHRCVKSSQLLSWKCQVATDHRWQSRLCDRMKSSGCPYCTNVRVTKSNCLATTHVNFAEQWHSSLNGELTPSQITSGSNKSVWWKCSVADDHVWKAMINSRVRYSSGCPYCYGKKASSTNNLQ